MAGAAISSAKAAAAGGKSMCHKAPPPHPPSPHSTHRIDSLAPLSAAALAHALLSLAAEEELKVAACDLRTGIRSLAAPSNERRPLTAGGLAK